MSEKGNMRGFLSFLRGRRGAVIMAVLLVLGAFLIFAGGAREEKSADLTDEERLAALCSSVEGVGECRVYLTYTPATHSSAARVESVAIACRGASSAEVRAELTALVSSLYGIGSNRICIVKMRE